MTKRISNLIRVVCLILLATVGSIASYANHLVGMDLYYTYVSGTTYKITLVAYADCGSAGTSTAYSVLPTNRPVINIYNGSSYISTINLSIEAPSTGVEITPVCPKDLSLTQCTNLSYTIPGIKKFVYSGTYTLSGPSTNWSFLFTGDMGGSIAGRAVSITNISSTPDTYIQLEATLNNTISPNNSPALTVIPTPFFCVNNSDNYNPGAIDADGDALTFNLVTGMDGTTTTARGGPVTYLGTATPTAPLATSSFAFDNLTGQISFYPNTLQRSLVVYNVEERRGGVLVGTCQREMTFLVLTCTNIAASGGLTSATNAAIDDSTHLHVCQGAGAFSVNIDPTEPVKTNNITVTSAGLPAGSSFVVTGNGTNAPHCVFSWTTAGVAPGTYTFFVTYTDDNCPLAGVTTLAYTITVLANPTLSYTAISPVSCTQQAAISVIPGGGGTPWTMKVVNTVTGDTIQSMPGVTGTFTDSLPPGTYTILSYSTVSMACYASVSVTIAAPTPRTLTGTFTNPSFCGNNDGTIKIAGLNPGETDTINYNWNGTAQTPVVLKAASDGTAVLSGLYSGVYTAITATFGRFCVSKPLGPITLTDPAFTMRAVTHTDPSYCGMCDGTMTLYGLHPGQTDTIFFTIDGVAQPPLFFTIGTDSMVKLTGLCQGTYANIVARTGSSCISNKLGPVLLAVPPFTIRAVTSTNPDYCGTCNGTITIYGVHPGMLDSIFYTKDGVTQPTTWQFVGTDSVVKITGLCPGIYTKIGVKYSSKCGSNTLGPVLLAVPPFTMRSITYTNPDYCGTCNGVIVLHGLFPGQTDTVNYTLDGVPQSPVYHLIGTDSTVTITGLCPGTYANFVTNTAGSCISNKLGPVTLTVPAFTMRAISATNPDYCGICNGTVKLYGLHPGQTDTINYTMDGVPQTRVVKLIGADSTATITGLCAGVYDNFIANTGGICVSNTLGPVALTVPQFTMRGLSSTDPDYCGVCNGTIKIYGLHPGQTDTVSFTKDGVPQVAVSRFIGADSTMTITGLCAGVYDKFIAHTGGICISNQLGPVTLTVPPFTMRALSYTDPEYCGICNGTITLYGLHPGQTDSIHFTIGGVAQTPVVQTVGSDSTIKLTGLCAGLYDNFVAHTGGVCVSNTLGPANLTVPPFTMRAVDHTDPDFCGICNGTLTFYGLHPGQTDSIYYTIGGVAQTPFVATIGSDSTVKITGLCAGTYDNFIARTAGVCASAKLGPADLVIPPFTMRKLQYVSPTKCGFCDGYIKLYGLHPGQMDTIYYTLNGVAQTPIPRMIGADSTVTLTDLCDGVYSNFIARTGGVCATNTLGPATLKAPPIVPDFDFSLIKTCMADTAIFTNKSTPATDLTYLWDFGDSTELSAAVNPKHVYTKPGLLNAMLTITNTKCVDSIKKQVNIDNLITASYTMAPDSFLCQGKEVTFTNGSTGTGLTYMWFFGDGSVSNLANPKHTYYNTGNYSITMVASNDMPCHDTVTKKLAVDSISYAKILATDSAICTGHNVTFRGIYSSSGLSRVVWTFADGTTLTDTNIVTYPYTVPGTFPIKLNTYYRACPNASAQKSVVVFGYPELDLGPDTFICLGSSAITLADRINADNRLAKWFWSTGETTPSINVVQPGKYYASVSIYGCPTVDTVTVYNDCYMNIPNVFSPNGDGTNDYFLPRNLLTRGLSLFKMNIFNRWGQEIFSTTNIEGRGWDGTFNGVPQPEGVFIYQIEATFKDGQIEVHKGNITLIR